MRKATWREAVVSTQTGQQQQQEDVLRRACRGVVGRLENLESRQLLTTVLDWQMDEGTGLEVADDATTDGAQTGYLWDEQMWVPSRGAGLGADAHAVSLDGVDQVITTDDIGSFLSGTASVSFWIKTTAVGSNDPRLAPAVTGTGESGSANTDIFWGFLDASGRIGLHVPGTLPTGVQNAKDTVKSTLPVNDGSWHHVTMTRDLDSGAIQIYVDGVLNDSGVASNTARVGSAPVRDIGFIQQTPGADRYLNAQLDQFRIDDDVITAAAVNAMFNPSGLAPAAPTNVQVTYTGARAARLTWTPAPSASQYEVWVRTNGTGDFVKAPANLAGNSGWVTGLSPATNYEIQLRAVNGSGTSGPSNTVTTSTTAAAAPGAGNGLFGIYYDQDGGPGTNRGGDMTPFNSVGPVAVRIDPQVAFDWGDGRPHPQIDVNNFTARWEGEVLAQYTEPYTFLKSSDDGFAMQIEINGQWVTLFQDWDYQGMEPAPGDASQAVNLVAGQKYKIRLEQFDGDGGSGAFLRWASPSTPAAVIPQSQLFTPTGSAPAAPTLTGTTGTANGGVDLTWTDNSANELGFVILRSSTGGAGTFREIGRVAGATAYTDQTLPGTTYFYQVRAFNGAGESASSNTVNVQPNASLRGLKVDYYRGEFTNPSTAVTGAILDTQVIANPDRFWGAGAPSAAVGPNNFTSVWTGTLNITEPGTYTFYTNTDDGSFIWVDNTLVLNDPTYHGNGTEIIGIPNYSLDDGDGPIQPPPNAENLPPNGQPIELTAGTHQIVIRAFEGGGDAGVRVGWIKPSGTKETIPTGVFGTQTLAAPPAPGAAPATGVFSEKVTINWTNVTGEAAFFLERATTANFSDAQQIAQLNADVTSYTDEEVTPGNRYFYRVRAANQGGYSAYTITPDAAGILTLTDEPIPEAPTNLLAALRPNLSARVTWTDNSANEANFILQRSTDGTNFTDLVTLPANTTGYTNTGLTNGTTYTYRVVAINGQDERSTVSNVEDVIASNTTIVSPWTSTDIGGPARAGSASYDAEEGQYTVIGSGGDIWGTNDQLHFLHQQVTGDFQVTARVIDFTNPVTDAWAKAGVMVREELTGGSQHAINAVTGSNQVHMQGRLVTGGESFDNGAPGGSQSQRGWVRLVRTGQTITGYWSADGVNWVQNGTRTFEGLNDTLYVGLGNTAHDNNDLNEVVFDNFSIVSGAPTLAPTSLDATPVPGDKVVVSWRDANPVVTGYRLERSSDGTTWAQIGGDLPGSTRTYIDSPTAGGTYTYRVRAFNGAGQSPNSTTDSATPATGQTGAPTGWTSVDIGTTALPGSANYLDGNKSFQVVGSGGDIWGNADAFQYVYQPVTGDATIVARVLDVSNTDPWAKAALMFRETLTAGSQHVMMASSRDNGVEMQGREVADAASFGSALTGEPARPFWLKLERVGDTFNGYISEDGVTWSATPAVTRTVDMDDTIYVGLAVTSHDNTETNTSYFEGVTVTTGTPVPSGINLNGTAANDNWYLKRVGDQVHVWNNADGTGTAVSQHALGQALTLNGQAGNDTVTIDLSGGDINLSSLTINGADGSDKVRLTNGDGKVLTLGAMPTLEGQTLDVGTADLKLTGTTIAAVDALLASARNGATRWQGPGIGTSSATNVTGLAPVQQAGDVLVKYTYNGDANGDGRVNADDYFRIDQGFLSQPANATYNQGDFNYDNRVNADDYFLIDQAFLGQGPQLGGTATAASTPVAATAAEETATPVVAPTEATAAPATEIAEAPAVAAATTPTAAVVTADEASTEKKSVRRATPESSLFGSRRIEKRGTTARRSR